MRWSEAEQTTHGRKHTDSGKILLREGENESKKNRLSLN